MRLFVFAFSTLFAFATSAFAEGIAMHGEPKYQAAFSHFDYVNPDPPKGGLLRLSAQGSFDSLNPFIIRGTAPDLVSGFVYESLLARSEDEPFSLYPRIASRIDVPDDRSFITFHLNPEARFHDGHPVRAEDVVFSLKTLRDQGRPNHHAYYSQVAAIEVIDELTVKLTFAADGNRELPLILGLMPILPQHYFRDRPFDQVSLEAIPGTGPYRIESVEPGRQVILRRVKDHWGRQLPVNRGRYNFDEIRVDFFRDATTALEAFRAGLIDFRQESSPARWHTGYGNEPDMIREALAHGRPSGMLGLVFNTRRPIFRDRRVRNALLHAFDFTWINQTLFHGAYSRPESYFDNSPLAAPLEPSDEEIELAEKLQLGPPETLAPLPRSNGKEHNRANLRKAAALLSEAGWRIENGILKNSAGNPLTFTIMLGEESYMRPARQFARDLKRLGIEADVRLVDGAQHQQRMIDYDYDMTVFFWGQSLSPGNEQAFYWSCNAADTPGTRNYMGVCDPAIDALLPVLADARDRRTLRAAVRLIDRRLRDGLYVIPLYYLDEDWIAYYDHIARPERVPVSGVSIDTFWHRIHP